MGIEHVSNPVEQTKVSRYEAKYREKLEREQKELRARMEKEQITRELANQFAPKGFVEGQYDVKDYSRSAKDKIDTEIDNIKKMYKEGKLTKEEYKAAKKRYDDVKDYIGSKEWKREKQAEINSKIRTNVAGYIADAEGTSVRKVNKDVKADLKEMLESGEITKEQYDAYKGYLKQTKGIGRFFGKKEKESRGFLRVQANSNNVEATQKAIAEGKQVFDPKMQAKLNIAGFTTDDLYEIYDNNGGAADRTINYSWKKNRQGLPAERDGILARLNQNEAGYKFDMGDVKEIGRDLGYEVEKKVDGGKVVRDVGRGMLIGAPGAYVNIQQSAVGGSLAVATAQQSVKAFGVGPAIGGTIGGVTSAITQAHRVEPRAIPTDVPKDIKTYDDYAKYLDSYSTKEGAALGKDIAKFFVDAEGTFRTEEMNKALKEAAGTVDGTLTPLNYDEAKGLLTELAKNPPKLEIKKPEPEPKKDELILEDKQKTEIVNAETDCYTVKPRDTWDAITRAVYKPKTNEDLVHIRTELKKAYLEEQHKQGKLLEVKSWTEAFFPAAGEELCLPTKIKGKDGKNEYSLNVKANVNRIDKEDWNPDKNVKTGYSANFGEHYATEQKRTVYHVKDKEGYVEGGDKDMTKDEAVDVAKREYDSRSKDGTIVTIKDDEGKDITDNIFVQKK